MLLNFNLKVNIEFRSCTKMFVPLELLEGLLGVDKIRKICLLSVIYEKT